MMSDDPLLWLRTAPLPDLLRPGCPVVLTTGSWAPRTGIWLPNTGGPDQVAFPISEEMGTGWGMAPVRNQEGVVLDLSQVTGRQRAALWLAERQGFWYGSTGASWKNKWAGVPRMSGSRWTGQEWALQMRGQVASFAATAVLAELIVVPALADLQPETDLRKLSDGSRWTDARALVLCCEAAVKGLSV